MGRFFIVQGVSLLLSWGIIRWGLAGSWEQWVMAQALGAALLSWFFRHPPWWMILHLGFLPVGAVLWEVHWPRWIYGLGFIGLLGIYWSTFRTRVPLYLTHQTTLETLTELVELYQPRQFADLGCGTGTVLRMLAKRFPQVEFHGWEVAPLPWLLARWGTHDLPNCRITLGSFWTPSMREFDMVYVFLSPVPMSALWEKICAEMKTGALLISNSFLVPGILPWQTRDEDTVMPLYLYQPPGWGARGI
ncbi:MAG: class I SAM-dependent methyltransferase [Betaproteobacteria bacterium]|jgi:Trans-aconitate methyltransferase|nr:class I SAM-dependent methyltransferase [Betaproteobacteria bacterium]